MQQFLERIRRHARDGRLLRDQPFLRHVHGDLHGGARGAFARSRLQHPELAALDRELDVLHFAVVLLETLLHAQQFLVGARKFALERGQVLGLRAAAALVNGLRRTRAGDHVLALRVLQVLAVEHAIAGGRIAREGDARGAVVAHVPEHHRLHVHRGAPGVGDAVNLAVLLRALVLPRAKHRGDRAPELLVRILGERAPRRIAHDLEVLAGKAPQVFRAELRVRKDAALFLQRFELRLEAFARHAQGHVAIHLDEAAVAVVGEALAGSRREARGGALVQAEIQDRVHHAGHRGARAGAHRHE